MQGMRPIDIARKLQVSTSALRYYEEWGMVPPIERGKNGYRIYTEKHAAYFESIRAVSVGFGMGQAVQAHRLLLNNEANEALWLLNQAQAELNQEKHIAEKTIEVLSDQTLNNVDARGRRKWMSIGEVSQETGIAASAIRHWEKEGLLSVVRNQDNGYRTFSPTQIRQILIIGTLRSAVYSLDTIRQVIKELDHNNVEQARKIAIDSLKHLHRKNDQQMRGICYFYTLIERN